MDAILFSLGARPVTVAEALTAAAVGVAVLLVLALFALMHLSRARRHAEWRAATPRR